MDDNLNQEYSAQQNLNEVPFAPPPSIATSKPKSHSLIWLVSSIILFFIGLILGMVGKNYYLAQAPIVPSPTPPLAPTSTPTPAPVDETANWKIFPIRTTS